MTLEQVLAAKAANQQVSYKGQPVTIVKASLQMVYVTHGAPTNDRTPVDLADLLPLP